MKQSLLILFLLALFIIGCTKDNKPLVLVKPSGCDSIEFSYEKDVKPIISSRCSGFTCHSGGNSNYNYSTYAVVADRIRSLRFEERLLLPEGQQLHMPEGSSLSDCELFTIRAWIHQGFKNN